MFVFAFIIFFRKYHKMMRERQDDGKVYGMKTKIVVERRRRRIRRRKAKIKLYTLRRRKMQFTLQY